MPERGRVMSRLPTIVDSPWSIVDVWFPVALATPCSVCVITEFWSASAIEVAPGDRMFALTAASIGAAMFALAASAALIGAARSSARSRLTSRFSSDAGAASRSPPVPVLGGGAGVSCLGLVDHRVLVGARVGLADECLLQQRVLRRVGERRRVRRERAGAHRCVDRHRRVGVQADGRADRSRDVEVGREVGVEVQQRAALERAEHVGDGAAERVDGVVDRGQHVSDRVERVVTRQTCRRPSERVVDGGQRVADRAERVVDDAADGADRVVDRGQDVLPTVPSVSLTTPPTVPTVSSTAGRTVSPTVPSVSLTTPPTVPTVSSTAGRTCCRRCRACR